MDKKENRAITIELKADIKLGILATHTKFVGGVAPDENGKLARENSGELVMLESLRIIMGLSPVKIDAIQISSFPGVDPADIDELARGIKEAGLEMQIILMCGGVDPMNPDDEDAVVDQLLQGLEVAKKYGVEHVASTSFEEWMKLGSEPKKGDSFDDAVAQLVKVHLRAYREADLEHSCIKNWDLEFLRTGEFQTFTDIKKSGAVVSQINKELGNKFFKLMVDAAHCGNSGLNMPENIALIKELAEKDELGIFHASAPTTRGCLSSDDGWIATLLTACAQTGKLKQVFVEIFHHEDPALEGLRNFDPGHGIDTTDGRSYNHLMVDGLIEVSRRLNNLAARGVLQ